MVGRVSRSMVEEFKKIPSSTLSDVLDKLGLSGVAEGIKPITGGVKVVGPAFTVIEEVGRKDAYTLEDFGVGSAIEEAEGGEVLVFSMGGARVSTWGGLASLAAKVKGLEGVVVDGGVRDVERIRELKFPVFARHVTPVSGKTRVKVVSLKKPVVCGGVLVKHGDLVVGDDTGVVFVPLEAVEEVLEEARKIEEKEASIEEGLKKGLTLSEAARRYRHI